MPTTWTKVREIDNYLLINATDFLLINATDDYLIISLASQVNVSDWVDVTQP